MEAPRFSGDKELLLKAFMQLSEASLLLQSQENMLQSMINSTEAARNKMEDLRKKIAAALGIASLGEE